MLNLLQSKNLLPFFFLLAFLSIVRESIRLNATVTVTLNIQLRIRSELRSHTVHVRVCRCRLCNVSAALLAGAPSSLADVVTLADFYTSYLSRPLFQCNRVSVSCVMQAKCSSCRKKLCKNYVM